MLTLLITAHRTNYLLEALLSVAAQSCKDFHLICCADVRQHADVYDFFKTFEKVIPCKSMQVLKIHGNGTAGFIRNIGFQHASTEWVSYLDGDDMLLPHAIETVLNNIQQKNGDIFSSGIIRIERDGRQTMWEDSITYYPPLKIYHEDPDSVCEPTYFNHFQTIRKRVWETYPYNDQTNGEDIDFLLHHLLQAKFYKIPAYLYAFRNTPDSFSTEKKFVDCDICTIRYQNGYYTELLEKYKEGIILSNFREGRS